MSDNADEQYKHKQEAVQRPDVGVQGQFTAKKPSCVTSRVPSALACQRLITVTFPLYKLTEPSRGSAGCFAYRRKQSQNGEEIGGLVPRIPLKSMANDESPSIEIIVDRPEELKGVVRFAGPLVVEAT